MATKASPECRFDSCSRQHNNKMEIDIRENPIARAIEERDKYWHKILEHYKSKIREKKEDLQAYFTEQMHLKDFSAAQKLNAEIAALNWVLDLM